MRTHGWVTGLCQSVERGDIQSWGWLSKWKPLDTLAIQPPSSDGLLTGIKRFELLFSVLRRRVHALGSIRSERFE